MIELLFAIALVGAVPLAMRLGDRELRTGLDQRLGGVALSLVVALALPRGVAAASLAVPWLALTVGRGVVALVAVGSRMRDRRDLPGPAEIGHLVAGGYVAVGAGWALVDRAGLTPFGFPTTIVLLTAVHFHVAGLVLTTAGALAAGTTASRPASIALFATAVGTPVTAVGFFGLPLVAWIGAVIVAVGALGIGAATILTALRSGDRIRRVALGLGGATLFVTMPLAAVYATGTTFGIPVLDVPAMAAVHGTLNVVGFAIPAMVGWSRSAVR